jgi:hypothetical protein
MLLLVTSMHQQEQKEQGAETWWTHHRRHRFGLTCLVELLLQPPHLRVSCPISCPQLLDHTLGLLPLRPLRRRRRHRRRRRRSDSRALARHQDHVFRQAGILPRSLRLPCRNQYLRPHRLHRHCNRPAGHRQLLQQRCGVPRVALVAVGKRDRAWVTREPDQMLRVLLGAHVLPNHALHLRAAERLRSLANRAEWFSIVLLKWLLGPEDGEGEEGEQQGEQEQEEQEEQEQEEQEEQEQEQEEQEEQVEGAGRGRGQG